ncbi:Ig domain-containing protein [Allorhizobium ampelinum]|uniref:Ig domain-containing protein n=1 Tax=Allorhizobium ampelinum TaxID=3025782 RepID=UPI001303C6F0|nr:Ig domain-containing protein [Allorhizobium ampelinum]NTA27380.1 hypothetical protein [Allorhizobium ampelinum]
MSALVQPSLALSASSTSINTGVTLTLTTTLTGGSSATGTVTFYDYGLPIGSVALSGGSTAVLSTSTLDARLHLLTAAYSGNAVNASAVSSSIAVTVSYVVSTVTISGTPGAATVGSAYSFTPTTANGSGTKTFAITGTLPSGLSFSTTTGAITGTPTTAGTSSGITITVTDSSGSASLSGLSIVVSAPVIASGTVLFNDTFTDTDGVFLSAHTSDSGTGWATQTGVTADIYSRINAGCVWNPATSAWTNTMRANTVFATGDYYVEGVYTCQSVVASEHFGISGRCQADANTLVWFRFNRSTNVWQLYHTVGGTSTKLAELAGTFNVSESHTLRMTLSGSTATCAVDGSVLSGFNAVTIGVANTLPGSCGLRMGGAQQTATTGTQLTSLKAVSL